MKRYWRLSTLVLVIIVSLGTLFTKQALSYSGLPQFSIKTLQGNPAELKTIKLQGNFLTGTSNFSLTIDRAGTDYQTRTFLMSLNNSNDPIFYQKLIAAYHQFMRGKAPQTNNYYEDAEQLVYATVTTSQPRTNGPRTNKLYIDILNKKTSKVTQFSKLLRSDAYYINICDVQMVGNLLKIVTQEQLLDGGSQFHVLTLNPEQKKLVKKDTIAQLSSQVAQSPQSDNLTYMSEVTPLKPNRRIILVRLNANGQIKTLSTYDLLSGIKKKLTLPKEIPASANPIGFDGTVLTLEQQNATAFTFYSYDIESDKLLHSFQVSVPAQARLQSSGEPPILTTLGSGRLYIQTPYVSGKGSYLVIKNSLTGETLYKGQLVEKPGSALQGQLQLYGIES